MAIASVNKDYAHNKSFDDKMISDLEVEIERIGAKLDNGDNTEAELGFLWGRFDQLRAMLAIVEKKYKVVNHDAPIKDNRIIELID